MHICVCYNGIIMNIFDIFDILSLREFEYGVCTKYNK